MSGFRFSLLFVAALASSFAFAQALNVSITADKADCVYKCGEDAVFMITAKGTNGTMATEGLLSVKLNNFGGDQFLEEKIDLSKRNPAFIKGRLMNPGFLAVYCTDVNSKDSKTRTKIFSCAYDPLKIKQGVPKPADFDSFWDNAVRKLEETVPLDPEVKKNEKHSNKQCDVYNVSFATANGQRVYGYLSVPVDKSKAPFPVRVTVPGAGCAHWSNMPSRSADAICLMMTVFPFEPNVELEKVLPKYDALNKEAQDKYKCGRYSCSGISVSREAYFYYPVILGINRAINWVAKRDEVNRKHITYSGTSQGGGFGLYLMGLNKNFTKGVVHVPALTDLLGSKDNNRQSGWPRIVEAHPKELRDAVEKHAPYFCGANFASRIRIPVRFVVGFADNVCAPGAVYAGYNAVPSKDKKIYHGIGMGHGVSPRFYNDLSEWQRK